MWEAQDANRSVFVLVLILVTTAGATSSLDLDLDDIAFAVNQSRRCDGRKEERSDVGLRESKKLLVTVVVECWNARAKVVVNAMIKRRRKRATTFQRRSSGCFVGSVLLLVGH